jgi:DNA-binding HxlR family transcriptional regulator
MSSSQATKDKVERPETGEAAAEVALCPRFHRAVELIGRRWTGAIVQVLLAGPRRFNELLATIPGISDRLLSERLRELESEGVLRRVVCPGPPLKVEYALSKCGRELEPVLHELGVWAEHWVSAPASSSIG